ncbi:MAG TPA: MlaD family protein [Casimicrobiaceae bacterium]|nr:MlaD family protein [Casimicrobiaceae bacterium]
MPQTNRSPATGEPENPEPLPEATVDRPKRGRISVIWIIPLIAALVAIGLAVQRIRSEGPTIEVIFGAAEGIEAGKTLVKYKDVVIGRVTAVELTNDFSKVRVTAKIAKHAAGLMVDDASFWIVQPTVSLSGISGLGTLLSGNYIGFRPGKSTQSQSTFAGLDVAPVITDERGGTFALKANDLGSLDIGAPVYYRRLPVGQVIAYELAPDGNTVQIKVFIKAPYDTYVYPETRFWNASGIEASVGADGVSVRTESLVALLIGGLAFDIPPFEPPSGPAPANAVFTLYGDRAAAMKAPDAIARRYVLHFNESLRGLAVGAPVTFLGLPAGEVTSVGLEFDPTRANVRPRVVITYFPERLMTYATAKAEGPGSAAVPADEQKRRDVLRRVIAERGGFLKRLVEERGLRGQLKSGSLVTGQLYVSFDFHPEAPKAKVDLSQDEPELPVVPGTLVALEEKLNRLVDKIDKLPLDEIVGDIRKDLASLDQTLKSAERLVSDADTKLVPELKSTLQDVHRTLAAVERAANSADTSLLGSNAPAQQELREALQEFAKAARSLRLLADQLEGQPSSVIRGKKESTSGGR